jgi:hypothetical protein
MHDVGIFLATGQGFYQQLDSVGRNRWGDYTAAGSDSTGGGVTYFWFAGQYAKTLGGSRIWGTRIGRNAFSAVNQP